MRAAARSGTPASRRSPDTVSANTAASAIWSRRAGMPHSLLADTYRYNRYIRRRLKPSYRGGIIGFHLCGYGVLSLFGTAGRDPQINSCIYGNRRRSELSIFRGCVRLRLLRSRPFRRKPLYCVKYLFAVRNPSLNRTLCGRSERLQPTSFSGGLRRI